MSKRICSLGVTVTSLVKGQCQRSPFIFPFLQCHMFQLKDSSNLSESRPLSLYQLMQTCKHVFRPQ